MSFDEIKTKSTIQLSYLVHPALKYRAHPKTQKIRRIHPLITVQYAEIN